MEEGTSVYKVLTGKLTGKGLLERPRCKWEENITIGLK